MTKLTVKKLWVWVLIFFSLPTSLNTCLIGGKRTEGKRDGPKGHQPGPGAGMSSLLSDFDGVAEKTDQAHS